MDEKNQTAAASSEGKRFWWLKLKADYFKSSKMKRLRRLAGGEIYTIIYLKLQLASLENGGVITYKGYEDSFVEEIAFDIEEDAAHVAEAIAALSKYGMIEERDDASYFIEDTVNNTGSESDAAQRMRKMRKARNNVTC